MVHNDQALWGAASNEIVKMAYDEKSLGHARVDQRRLHSHRAPGQPQD